MIKRSVGEVIFDVINVIILCLIGLVTLYPFWYVLVASLSEAQAVVQGVWWTYLWPVNWEFSAYERVLAQQNIWTSYGNTLYIAFAGTAANLVFTILGAYPLSKSRLKGRKFFTMIMLITMWFSAGMMPTYLNLRDLNLLNHRTTLIIGWVVSAFYVVLLRTYFESGISESLEESAKMDGANDWMVLLRIYLPLAVPSLMTIGLYYFVEKWNAFFWSMIILKEESKVPLQVVLRKLVVQMQAMSSMDAGTVDTSVMNDTTVIYSTIMVATIPMLILYPFVQRFFVKGVMIGAVKG